MAINARTTFFFDDGKYGWSETFFSQPEGLEAAMIAAKKLATARFALLGQGPVFQGIRVSNDDVRRDALVAGGADILVGKDRPSEASDVPYSALLLRYNSGSQYWRHQFCRGVPDVQVTDPEDLLSKDALTKGFGTLLKALIAGQYMMKVQLRGAENPDKVITHMVGDAAGYKVTTAVAHGCVTDDKVRIKGAQGISVAKGVYTVEKVDDFILLLRRTTSAVGVAYIGGGLLTKIVYGFKLITSGSIVRQTHRDTGRPFDSPRGRRKSRGPTSV